MKIFQYAKANYGEHRRNLYASTGGASGAATRWEDVFGAAQQKNVDVNKVDSGYFSPRKAQETAQPAVAAPKIETGRDPLSAYSGMNSMNLRIQPKQIEYERYQRSNDAEKLQIEQKAYDASKITNPFHHSKTYNMFNNDLRAAFKETYGDWDGKSEDGKGFAYVDKYGFSHVSDNFFSALIYSMDGKVYNYEGKQMGGYAVNAKGDRVALLGLDNSILYGNFRGKDSAIAGTDKKSKETMTPIQAATMDFENKDRLSLFDFSKVSGLRNLGRLGN